MEFLGILLLIIWLVAGGLGAARRRRQGQVPQRPAPPAPDRKPGSLFDRLRAELERMQQEAEAAERARRGESVSTRPRVELPEELDWEEPETLEVEPVIRSREVPPPPLLRETVAQDDLADAIVRRRIQEAEARNRALSLADHRAFDQRIRAPAALPAGVTAPRRRRQPIPLQNAVIWREILGPPKALE